MTIEVLKSQGSRWRCALGFLCMFKLFYSRVEILSNIVTGYYSPLLLSRISLKDNVGPSWNHSSPRQQGCLLLLALCRSVINTSPSSWLWDEMTTGGDHIKGVTR